MKVNFNGMRRRLLSDSNLLIDTIEQAIEDNDIRDDDVKEEIVQNMNELQRTISSFMCLFDNEVQGDMDDLSDLVTVKYLEE